MHRLSFEILQTYILLHRDLPVRRRSMN